MIRVLQELAKDEDGDVRRAAAAALGKVGKANPDAVLPTWQELAKDEGYYFRGAAAAAALWVNELSQRRD